MLLPMSHDLSERLTDRGYGFRASDLDTCLDALLLSDEVNDIPGAVALRDRAMRVEFLRAWLAKEVGELRREIAAMCGHAATP